MAGHIHNALLVNAIYDPRILVCVYIYEGASPKKATDNCNTKCRHETNSTGSGLDVAVEGHGDAVPSELVAIMQIVTTAGEKFSFGLVQYLSPVPARICVVTGQCNCAESMHCVKGKQVSHKYLISNSTSLSLVTNNN